MIAVNVMYLISFSLVIGWNFSMMILIYFSIFFGSAEFTHRILLTFLFIGAIINAGIKKVVARVTPSAAEHWQESFAEAAEMFEEAGVEVKLVEIS